MSSYHASAPVPTKPLGSARTLVRAGFTPLTENEQPFTHAPAGRRSQTRVILVVRDQRNREPLFLTSKVRLHCDVLLITHSHHGRDNLFLTSKVRLHCDRLADAGDGETVIDPFPDLKGQAPLRLVP